MTDNICWVFLETLKRAGIGGFELIPRLRDRFYLSEREARLIVQDWQESYDPNDYDELDEQDAEYEKFLNKTTRRFV